MANFIDPSKIEEFKLLQLEGKQLASVGDLKASLQKFELAKQICPTPKVLQRIEKLKACLKNVDHPEGGQSLPHLSSTSYCTEINDENPAGLKSVDGSTEEIQMCNTIKTESKVLSDIQNIQCNQKPLEKKSISSAVSPQSLLKFKQLKNEAKQFAYDGKYKEAVNSFKRALSVYDCPNVKKYIAEIESLILTNNQQIKELENQSSEKQQHTSNSSTESSGNNSISMQSGDTKVLTENFKDELAERKHSSESVKEKSSLSDYKNDSDIERKLAEVKVIYEEARDLAADGKLTDALELLKKAQAIHETQKTQKRINKIKEVIAAGLDTEEESKMVEVAPGFSIYNEIYNKLYPYQREGVAWMWKLYKMHKGGVLGDDMGLGKTFQVIAFISGMIDADLVNHVLIIMPVSLLKNWEKEFKKWCPGIAVHDFHSGSKKEREKNKLRVQRRGHVLLTSYGMVVNNVAVLTDIDGSEFVWDYVILDEGHKIKNPTKTTKAVYEIPAKNRLVLTGTPIQNNLKELWSLYDFVHQGTLLGSLKTFKLQYENPITRSREKDATAGEKRLGLEMAENLKELIKPYFLRRTKDEVWKKKDEDVNNLEIQMDNMKISQVTAKKNDLILWTYMSEPQIAIYQDFLHSDAVKSILVSKRSPLVELTTLKKICDHPRLLSQRACFHLGLNGDLQHQDMLDLDDEATLASSIDNVTDECLLKESGKLKLVIDLLENLKQTGHRTLVFSLSRKILDMIHRILVNRNWKVMRLDGTIIKTTDREKRIMIFQNDPSYPVFLLTTQVGGVGITLTAADRVIIYDPSWNPATDAQAVDRAYRIGQAKDVVVYRLITCGTVEEKIYRRQIFKDSITRQATGVADPFRYFSKQELRELFSLDDPLYSATQVQLHEMHSSQRSTYDELEKHLDFLKRLNIFGISDHDLMFSKEVDDQMEDNDPYAISEQFIKQKVASAHAQIQMEASVAAEGIRAAGTYSRPYQETIPLTKKIITKDPYKPPVLPDIIDLSEDAQNSVFPSNTTKSSFTPRGTFEDDDDIQIISPKSKNGSILDDKQYLSPFKKMSENAFPKSNEPSFTKSPSKDFSQVPEIISKSENAIDYLEAPTKFVKGLVDLMFGKTEKLRKSNGMKDEISEKLLENTNKDEDMNFDETRVKQTSEDEDDEQAASDLQPLNSTCNMKEKFQANLTHYMNDDITDFSFDEKDPVVSVKKGRKSCARQSTLLISESDTSCPNSASNSNISMNLVDESESDSDDSSNSASVPMVPESAYSTPQTPKYFRGREYTHNSVNETPPVHLEPESLSSKNSPISEYSSLKKQEGSVKRITPLKVEKSNVQGDLSFAQAMANSIILTPESSPKTEQLRVETNDSEYESSDEEEAEDSPLQVVKRKAVRQIDSDSEESDIESYTKNRDHSSIKNEQSYQEHLKSLSVEEELGRSECDDNVKEQSKVDFPSIQFGEKQDYSEENDSGEKDQNKVEIQSNNSVDFPSNQLGEKQDYSKENDSGEKDQNKVDIQSNNSGKEHSQNSDNEKEQNKEEVQSNEEEEEQSHSESDDDDDGEERDEIILSDNSDIERSSSGSISGNESGDHSDLEQTFATCDGKIESNSEDDLSTEDSEDDYSGSDESGSLFSEDE